MGCRTWKSVLHIADQKHILNGQKLRHFAMNKQVSDIQDTLKEVKRVAGDIKRRNKKTGRQQGK